MEKNNRVEVNIGGNDYVLYSDRETDEMLAIANYVEKKIAAVPKSKHLFNKTIPITLAAVNITDELFALREDHKDLENRARRPMEEHEPNLLRIDSLEKKNHSLYQDKIRLQERISDLEKSLASIRTEADQNKGLLAKRDEQIKAYQDKQRAIQDKLDQIEKKNVDLAKQLQEVRRTNR